MGRPMNIRRARQVMREAEMLELLQTSLKAFEALTTAEHSRNFHRLLTGTPQPATTGNPCHDLAYHMAGKLREFLNQGN